MLEKERLIEIFHFINPLGKLCYYSEQAVCEFASERFEKVSIRFIPFINLKIIQQMVEDNKTIYQVKDIDSIYKHSYMVALALYAASMQGKKFGRSFLMALQDHILNHQMKVSSDLFTQVAQDLAIDVDVFMEDYQSETVKRHFIQDQILAQDMQIQSTPSSVIYMSSNPGVGYLVESCIEKEEFHAICQGQVDKHIHYRQDSNLIYPY